jgi:hypothetical protein
MGRSSVRNWFLFAVTAYLALATMGTFIFMSPAVPCFEDLAGNSQAQNTFLTSVSYPIEYLAISTTKDYSFSLLRQCLPRMAVPVSFLVAGSGLLCTAIKFITKATVHNIKNTILLKLRI